MPQRQNKKRKSKSSAVPPQPAQEKRKEKAPGPSTLSFATRLSLSQRTTAIFMARKNGRLMIRWNKDDWQRADGTSEEWIPEPRDTRSTHANLVKKYRAREFSKLGPLETRPFNISSKDDTYYSHLYFGAPGCSKNLWNQTNYLGVFGMGDAPVSRFYMTDPDFIPEDNDLDSDSDQGSDRRPPRARNVLIKQERSTSLSLGGSPVAPAPHFPLTALQELERKWNRAASDVGAGPITLRNDIDKTIPSLKKNFEYSEMELRWSPELRSEGYPLGPENFTRCDCSECDINYPYKCGCQAPILDPARPESRISLLMIGTRLCRPIAFKSCRCPQSCPNRVLQRPRSVHIEIVKYEIRGWGFAPERGSKLVKSSARLRDCALLREIITKEAASRIPSNIATTEMSSGQRTTFKDRNLYMFDIDSQHNKYTLDCWAVGNWTRFINHKCEPNLKIFSVLYDTLPDTGLERHAVVALKDIPAGEELGLIIIHMPSQERERFLALVVRRIVVDTFK
ncbi:Pre-SET motif [Rhizoctonia solani]|uniref:Pre-SET motif n=1 Tax=Rhizoctonia solani TaxID=456999 RepID=A0A8H7IM91_9AGAM|nr:Pre-SET motif [Rhizoctonia solani]